MLTGLAALEAADWSRLHHAYGRATDTPGHLRSLVGLDLDARAEAIKHLWSAVIHQGTPWMATETVALVVVGLLNDERIDLGTSVRSDLLRFLVAVAKAPQQAGFREEELERMAAVDIGALIDAGDYEAIFENEATLNSYYAQSIQSCIRLRPLIMEVMFEGLGASSAWARSCAAMGVAEFVASGTYGGDVKDVVSRLLTMADATENVDERSSLVLALGEIGFSPRRFLADASPGVRMCAALAPDLATDPAAITVLLDALENHAKVLDDWFVDTPPQFRFRPRFSVVDRLIQQVPKFETLADSAIALASVTTHYTVDYDWGRFLAKAFPDGRGVISTDAQRRFVRALVSNEKIWNPKSGNAERWFDLAGLPYDRQKCSTLVGGS